jgi:hypothetical protein
VAAVATGSHTEAELAAAGADRVLPDPTDTEAVTTAIRELSVESTAQHRVPRRARPHGGG